jgi:hypothetical protein
MCGCSTVTHAVAMRGGKQTSEFEMVLAAASLHGGTKEHELQVHWAHPPVGPVSPPLYHATAEPRPTKQVHVATASTSHTASLLLATALALLAGSWSLDTAAPAGAQAAGVRVWSM